ncbi:dynamin family protein [Mongoliibacter ruber]|uniref:Dynamin family protein n=1 Tax=Mongoliibacter ruber TaxID=1750599 RepID=A0A2T0WSV3_9BACT|nr:dynamin family protein [Mongoliibacter ruber]PRY89757.1 dynamin family protein [Mongoliibacter ruber]
MKTPLELKQILINSSERIESATESLDVSLSQTKVKDSSGNVGKNIFNLIESIQENLQNLSKSLESPFKIAVVGSQGTGKSSLVNLLIGEALMPSTISENESAVIKLAYPYEENLNNKAVFELINGEQVVMEIDQAKIIIDKNRRSSKDDEFIRNTKYVTFYYKLNRLEKIEIINTPGMNVLTEDFYPKVKHLFVESDVILWVNGGEKILDSFNSWLIKMIHADNNKIVGFITFPDKLYRMDPKDGVTDVVTQFMENLEEDKLIRFNDEVALFIFNGLYAQIGQGQKSNIKCIQDLDRLDDDESNLRMLHNYWNHGFAYSDDSDKVKILKDLKLYGIQDCNDLGAEFVLNEFVDNLLKKGICEKENEDNGALYTELGLKLLDEASQFEAFNKFTGDYLIPESKKGKSIHVIDRLQRMLSTTESKDNLYATLLSIESEFKGKINELDSEEKQKNQDFENLIEYLKIEIYNWHEDNIGNEKNLYVEELVNAFSDDIEKEIDIKDLLYELVVSSTMRFFGSKKESAISKKISKIIEKNVEDIFPKALEKYAVLIGNNIELILLRKGKELYLDKDKDFNKEGNASSNFKSFEYNNNSKKLSSTITKILGPLIKNLLIKVAKKDLRKGANNFLKTRLIKPLVILIRKLLTKAGIKLVKGKAASSAGKSILGPVGWALIIYDIVDTVLEVKNMFKNLKESIKDSLNNEKEFGNTFITEGRNVVDMMVDEVNNSLQNEIFQSSQEANKIRNGLNSCEILKEEFNKLREL